jgi:Bacterial Ig domain
MTPGKAVLSATALMTTACFGLGGDDSPPDLEILTPLHGQTVSGSIDIQVIAVDDESEVMEVRFFVGSTLLLTDTQRAFTASWDTQSYADGPQEIRVEAEDTEGNSSVLSIVVVVDNTITQELRSPSQGR